MLTLKEKRIREWEWEREWESRIKRERGKTIIGKKE